MSLLTLSVAILKRNAFGQLRRCVGSIRRQPGASVEHLVQNACSSDGTPEWLRSLPLAGAVSVADGGMYDAINHAGSRASSRCLAWLNANRHWLPGILNRVQSAFASYPQAEVFVANWLAVHDAGFAVALRREIPLRRFLVVNTFLNDYFCTLSFKRSLLDRGLLPLNTSRRYAADMELALLEDLARRHRSRPAFSNPPRPDLSQNTAFSTQYIALLKTMASAREVKS
jgi:hypothetical protein